MTALSQHLLADPHAYLVQQLGGALKHYVDRPYESLSSDNIADLYILVAFGKVFTEREFKDHAWTFKQLSRGRFKYQASLEHLAKALGYTSYGSMRFLNRDGQYRNVRFHDFKGDSLCL